MKRLVLLDTGPLVAYLSRRDRFHAWANDWFGRLAAPLLTCEAVLAEAAYLLRPEGARVLEMLERKALAIGLSLESEAGAVRSLMQRYGAGAREPMDLADACLVRMSELWPESTVFTLDHEFTTVYRKHGRQAIPTLLPPVPRASRS